MVISGKGITTERPGLALRSSMKSSQKWSVSAGDSTGSTNDCSPPKPNQPYGLYFLPSTRCIFRTDCPISSFRPSSSRTVSPKKEFIRDAAANTVCPRPQRPRSASPFPDRPRFLQK